MGEETIFFETPSELRAWLEQHHATASELWLGYYKKGSGRRSLTWSQVVDEALCFGWIDGKAQRKTSIGTGSGSVPAGGTATGALGTSPTSLSCGRRDA